MVNLGASLVAQLVKNLPAMQETWFNSWIGKICWRRDRLPTPVFLGFPCGSVGKESTCNVGELGSIPGLGRCPEEGKGYPLQYSGLENSMDCIVYGVAKSQTQLSTFQFTSHRANNQDFWKIKFRVRTSWCSLNKDSHGNQNQSRIMSSWIYSPFIFGLALLSLRPKLKGMFVFVKQDTWDLISPFRGEWYINLSLPRFKVDAMPPKTAGHHKYNHKRPTGEEARTVNNVQQNGVLFRPFEHSVLLTTPPWPLWRDSSYRVNRPKSPESWLPASLAVIADFEDTDAGIWTK